MKERVNQCRGGFFRANRGLEQRAATLLPCGGFGSHCDSNSLDRLGWVCRSAHLPAAHLEEARLGAGWPETHDGRAHHLVLLTQQCCISVHVYTLDARLN